VTTVREQNLRIKGTYQLGADDVPVLGICLEVGVLHKGIILEK